MNLEELRQYLVDQGCEDAVIFDNCLGFDYAGAFVGISEDGRAMYDYDKMVEWIMETEGWEYEDAVEWIDFNTIRALPYAGPKGPIIIYKDEDEWLDGEYAGCSDQSDSEK